MTANDEAWQIMQMALESAKFAPDKEREVGNLLVNSNLQFYDFSDEEAIKIANRRVFGRNYTFVNPIIKRKYIRTNLAYLTISNENDVKEKTKIKITLFPFSGNFQVDKQTFFEEGPLRAIIAYEMIKKYGEIYRMSYAAFWVKKQKDAFSCDGNVEKHAKMLDRRLTAIGKRSPNSRVLLLGEYKYRFLQDMPEEELQNWVKEQE